jgi:HD superfamily phosphohydrolase
MKWDYLLRDSYNIGHKSTFDYKRLVNSSRVTPDSQRICFDEKEVFALYELFHTRYSLTKQVSSITEYIT